MGGLFVSKKKKKPKRKRYSDNDLKWLTLAPHIKKHFNLDTPVEEIAADLAYQEYLMNKGKK